MKRKAKIARKTKETNISVDINIDGKGKYKVDTGIGFLDHMLEQLSKHSSMDLTLKAIATALFALFCPTTNLSNSETISLGDNEF